MSEQGQATILVIDDDDTLLQHVEQILIKGNFAPICVLSGQAGLEKAVANHPDVIILDRRMPEMDGNETLIELKANENTKNIPVVMLTGDNMITDVQTSFELGAVDYIVKPFDQDDLLIRINKALADAKS